MDRPSRLVVVAEYDPCWTAVYKTEAALLLAAGPFDIVKVHHIGSTSVEGLAAKPIIDILIELSIEYNPARLWTGMQALGYEAMGEFGIPGREYFRKGRQTRTHQVHGFVESDPNVVRHIAFRDYLRAHAGAREEYAHIKREAATAAPEDIERYMDLKDPFIKRVEKLAMEWYAGRR